MTETWEYYDRIDHEVNGRTIKITEWRKEFDDGTAVIRSGYLRIDDCPRFQIVLLFKGIRVFADKPPFRKFDDALAASNEWLATRAKRLRPPPRRLTATPQPAKPLQLTAPDSDREPVFKSMRPRMLENLPPKSKFRRLAPSQKNAILMEEYYKLDHGRTSLQELLRKFTKRIGCRIHIGYMQKLMRDSGLALGADKDKALAIARPKIKKELARIIKENPLFGAGKCYQLLEKTELKGYRLTLVKEIYHEARREFGSPAQGDRHGWK